MTNEERIGEKIQKENLALAIADTDLALCNELMLIISRAITIYPSISKDESTDYHKNLMNDLQKKLSEINTMLVALEFSKRNAKYSALINKEASRIGDPLSPDYIKDDDERRRKFDEISMKYQKELNLPF